MAPYNNLQSSMANVSTVKAKITSLTKVGLNMSVIQQAGSVNEYTRKMTELDLLISIRNKTPHKLHFRLH